MRRSLLLLLLTILLFAGLVLPASADGIIIPIPRPPHPAPPLRSLAIRYHRVTVTIDNQVATTRVDQVFVNETPYEIEGEYIFPLPEEAAISQFAMWVDGQRLEAEVLDRDKARQIYEEIVRQQRDPALLEYAGRNAFRARIFPIPARGEKRIELEYTEVLPQDQGLVRYTYPLNTEKFSSRPLEEVAVNIRIVSREPIKAIYSPSHDLEVRRDGERRAEASYLERNVTPDRDLVLYYTVSPEDLGANLLTFREDLGDPAARRGGYFLLLLAPNTSVEQTAVVQRDVLLVLDISGSMRGEKLAQTKRAAQYVINSLNPGDRLNVVAFSSGVSRWAEGLRPLAERRDALAFVEDLRAGGGTDIGRAFRETLALLTADRPQIIVFLTDGQPTEGEVRIEKIIADVAAQASDAVRIFCFGVGYDVNTTLLDTIAQKHHGTSVYVRPDEDIERAVSSFYEKISNPVLTNISLDLQGVRVEDAYPYPLPDIFAGGQMVMVGRYILPSGEPAQARVILRGQLNGKEVRYVFDNMRFRESGGPGFIPRLWATRKIGHLLTQIRLHGQQRELVDEIVELSVRYGIVTPYTSFLIDESEDALTADGREALAARAAATPAPAPGAKGSAAPLAAEATGAQAVEKSVAQGKLREANVVEDPQAEQVRVAGDKTFVLRGTTWTDTTFDPKAMKPERVAFGSPRYFALLRQYPAWGRYLALGQEVLLVWQGRAYAIGAEAAPAEPALPEPTPTSTAVPTPGVWEMIRQWWKGLGR